MVFLRSYYNYWLIFQNLLQVTSLRRISGYSYPCIDIYILCYGDYEVSRICVSNSSQLPALYSSCPFLSFVINGHHNISCARNSSLSTLSCCNDWDPGAPLFSRQACLEFSPCPLSWRNCIRTVLEFGSCPSSYMISCGPALGHGDIPVYCFRSCPKPPIIQPDGGTATAAAWR